MFEVSRVVAALVAALGVCSIVFVLARALLSSDPSPVPEELLQSAIAGPPSPSLLADLRHVEACIERGHEDGSGPPPLLFENAGCRVALSRALAASHALRASPHEARWAAAVFEAYGLSRDANELTSADIRELRTRLLFDAYCEPSLLSVEVCARVVLEDVGLLDEPRDLIAGLRSSAQAHVGRAHATMLAECARSANRHRMQSFDAMRSVVDAYVQGVLRGRDARMEPRQVSVPTRAECFSMSYDACRVRESRAIGQRIVRKYGARLRSYGNVAQQIRTTERAIVDDLRSGRTDEVEARQ